MSEKTQVKKTLAGDGQEGYRISFEQSTHQKMGVSTTTTALLQEDAGHVADESVSRKPDKNLTAAIWTIVCGVALPCIPVIVVSIVLIYLVLAYRVVPQTGLPELSLPVDHTRCTGFTECISYARHRAGPVWYVDGNPSTITTIASWTSRVIPYLTSSIMALVAFFAARKIVTKSNQGNGDDLPSPEQLTLLIGLLGGSTLEPLKDTIVHRWAHKTKLVDPIPLAFSALLVITSLGLIIPLVDTWFGIATVPASITQLYPANWVLSNVTDIQSADVSAADQSYLSTRALDPSFCPNGPGGLTAANGTEWMSCNIEFEEASYTAWLRGSDEAVRVLQDATSAISNVSTYPANYTAGNPSGLWSEPVYYYLDNPSSPDNVDFMAKTIAIATQCAPITSRCLSNDSWPSFNHMDFSCSPAFSANFTFDGLSQGIDDNAGGSPYNRDLWHPVGMAFSQDAQLETMVGALDPRLWQTPPALSNLSGYEFLYPQNPLRFGAWAMGYPSFDSKYLNQSLAQQSPLLNDREVYRNGPGASWVLNCSATIYDVTYTFINGSVHEFNQTLASPAMGGFMSAPFAMATYNDLRVNALAAAAMAASSAENSDQLATMFADHWSRSALALSAGAIAPQRNVLTQFRLVEGPFARVPKVPFWTLLALKAIYVIAVILLAIGAYCFTHPAETEIVKTQLSAKGLAAAHFDTPDILQSKVVGHLNERLQPANKDVKVDVSVEIDPKQGGLKRAATFLGEMPDKKVGVVARADGAWRFAVVANGVWNGIAPIAVDLVGMQSKAGNLGEAGELVKAWIK